MRTALPARRLLLASLLLASLPVFAQAKSPAGCEQLPDHPKLKSALQAVVKQGSNGNTGLGNQQWAAVVNRDGAVCAVVFSGPDRDVQWPGSRLIAAEKASTANGFSTPTFSLSTANLYSPTQPGQSLWGLTQSAPPNPQVAYAGPASDFGTPNDPLVGKTLGGLIVFGGGLALYSPDGKLVGGLGTSGDTACADHIIAWKVRHALNLDVVPAGVGPDHTDNMILDVKGGASVSGFGHPSCRGGKPSDEVIKSLPRKFPVGKEP